MYSYFQASLLVLKSFLNIEIIWLVTNAWIFASVILHILFGVLCSEALLSHMSGGLFCKLLIFLGTLSVGIEDWDEERFIQVGSALPSMKFWDQHNRGPPEILGLRFLMFKPTWGQAQLSMETLCDARWADLLLVHRGCCPLGPQLYGALTTRTPILHRDWVVLAPGTKDPKNKCSTSPGLSNTFKAKVRLQHSTASLSFLPEYLSFFARSLMHLKQICYYFFT